MQSRFGSWCSKRYGTCGSKEIHRTGYGAVLAGLNERRKINEEALYYLPHDDVG